MSSESKVRIYGIDPGSISEVEKVNELDEIDLWLTIDGLGYHIWWCNHAMSHGRIEKVDLTEEQYALEYLVYQTRKFGVELPEAEEGKHVVGTPSYYTWYSFYSNHFKKNLTDKDWQQFQILKANGEDVSKYLPEGSWKDLLDPEKTNKLK